VPDGGLVAALRAACDGDVRAGEPLAPYTTLRVGGPASALVRAESVRDLLAVSEVCRERGADWLVLGRGSNLLVADEGWRGVAVLLGRGFRGVRIDGAAVEAGAAEPMPSLAGAVARAGLAGFAFAVAIPGTLGGAVRMNAGAHGTEMCDVLEWVEVVRLDRGAGVRRLAAADLGMRYRHSDLGATAVVVRARLRLRTGDARAVAADMAEMRRWRREHQPVNEPSCGSVFRNPDGDSAGRLVEAAGLRGLRIGGARISERHANFITTEPGARASDVLALIAEARARVAERHGVTLRTEVVLAGFEPPVASEERLA
jgi:UDP-N-acetylmuramate dehydrogenase